MIIDCISDLHGCEPELHGGDLLIVAGDLTARDTDAQHLLFMEWLALQHKFGLKYKKIIYIAGNHDGMLDPYQKRYGPIKTPEKWNIEYLCDSGTKFEGLKIWGSPWTPTFCNWYFMQDRGEQIRKRWEMIPKDTEILITHGPPYGILDKVDISSKGDKFKRAGCMDLMDIIPTLPNLKLHVFGHIHESPGVEEIRGTKFVNASIMNEHYRPVNKPIRIEL